MCGANESVDCSLPCDASLSLLPHQVKGKTIRLELPEEVQAGAGSCERSKASGHMKFTLPKLKAGKIIKSYKQVEAEKKAAAKKKREEQAERRAAKKLGMRVLAAGGDAAAALRRRRERNPLAVDLKGIYSGKDNPNLQKSERMKEHVPESVRQAEMEEAARRKFGVLGVVDDSDCPPLE